MADCNSGNPVGDWFCNLGTWMSEQQKQAARNQGFVFPGDPGYDPNAPRFTPDMLPTPADAIGQQAHQSACAIDPNSWACTGKAPWDGPLDLGPFLALGVAVLGYVIIKDAF